MAEILIIILLFGIVVYTCIRLYYFNQYLLRRSSAISNDTADKLLSITTDSPKKIPYFSIEDRAKIKEKWKKEGYLDE